jgi:hypothetical protein
MDQYKRDTSFITSTASGMTTDSKTSNASQKVNTCGGIQTTADRLQADGNADAGCAENGSRSMDTTGEVKTEGNDTARSVHVKSGQSGSGPTSTGTTNTEETEDAAAFPASFKYQSKASTAERGLGLAGHDECKVNDGRQTPIDNPYQRGETPRRNTHPTCKPVDLMRWLVRLVTPPGGTVLDPFLGSGTTAMACILEGVEWIGIEREQEYIDIARARVDWTEQHVKRYGRPPIDMGTAQAAKREDAGDDRQVSMFGGNDDQ